MLEVKNLSFQYKNQKVLEDISFDIPSKSVTCLIGPNGSGKTTLLDCIMGIHNNYSGEIRLHDINVAEMKTNFRMKQMSYVPQGKNHTFPFTVKEMVIMGRTPYLSFFEFPGEKEEEIALQALRDIGIEDYASRIFTKLSGGEQQLVILARALAQDTEILILDEPMLSLDYFHELQFLEILVRLIKEKNKSIITATHSPNHAFYFLENEINTQVLMLKKGEIAGYGQVDEVLNPNYMRKVFNIDASVITYDESKHFIIPKETVRE